MRQFRYFYLLLRYITNNLYGLKMVSRPVLSKYYTQFAAYILLRGNRSEESYSR